MRAPIVGHATEEIEHKAVALDVLRAHPSHALRILGFIIATVALFGWTFAGTRMLIKQGRLARSSGAAARGPGADDGRGIARLGAGVRTSAATSINQTDQLALARRRPTSCCPTSPRDPALSGRVGRAAPCGRKTTGRASSTLVLCYGSTAPRRNDGLPR
jgi:hypothetical protein